MAKTNSNTIHVQHPLSRRADAFKQNRNQHKRAAAVRIETAGQPKATVKTAQLACVLAVIFAGSVAALLGFFPALNLGTVGAGDTTPNTTRTELPAHLCGLSLDKQFEAIDKSPTAFRAETFNLLGIHYMANGNTDSAAKCFGKALSADPNLVAASNNLGTALMHEGNKSAARDAFASTLKMQPDNAFAKAQLERIAAK